ncbi:MAG: hypothetical protein ACU0BK_12235 [Shimia sp.]|uniref:hypothetical protein n=1 Tax=Shimia sp. TaxID=1954381 RepID=UPI004058830D
MSKREIRFAQKGEEIEILEFLREHWDSNFSVVKSRALFDHLYEGADGPNFVIARDEDRIVAILGFTIYDHVQKNVFLMLWRSIDSVGTTGIDLIRFLQGQGYGSISSVGVRPDVLVIYKLLGFQTGALKQWVKVNHSIDTYQILMPSSVPVEKPLLSEVSGDIIEVREFDPDFEYFNLVEEGSPFKPLSYLEKRYFQHPHYKYRVFAYREKGKIANYFVTRTVEYNGATALRLVECVAHEVGFVTFSIHVERLFETERHEYIDLYSLNFTSKTLEEAGYRDCEVVEDQIVPNYFEPFMQESEVKYYITDMNSPHLYKGDGDADRPFRLE